MRAADETFEGLRELRDLVGQGYDLKSPDADCAVHSFDVLPMPGSDHRALVAEIVLPRETS